MATEPTEVADVGSMGAVPGGVAAGDPLDALMPGSDAAVALGCTCRVFDNAMGLGASLDEQGEPMYGIRRGCPLHDAYGARD